MNLDQARVVRLNEEVKAVMLVKVHDTAKPDMGPGKPVYWDQIEDISDIQITEHDPNAGHVTLVGAPDGRWLVVFDFRYNTERVREVVLAADEFLNAPSFAAKQGYPRAFAENLFAAADRSALEAVKAETPKRFPIKPAANSSP
jgi:hypothetical protein